MLLQKGVKTIFQIPSETSNFATLKCLHSGNHQNKDSVIN